MDKLAAALGIDPVELRLRNALAPGDTLVTGQVITGAAPVAEVIRAAARRRRCRPPARRRLPRPARRRRADRRMPADVRRGVGFAVGFKNLMFSEGFDDYSTARVRLEDGVATVHCACAEVGQGFVTLAQQIAREVLGVDEVVLAPADTAIGSAGSTSASRQTWMSGGAVAARVPRRARASRRRRRRASRRRPRDARARRRPASSSTDGPSTSRCATRSRARCSRRRTSTTTTRRSRSTRTGRATRTSRSRSPRTAPSSTSTPSSA